MKTDLKSNKTITSQGLIKEKKLVKAYVFNTEFFFKKHQEIFKNGTSGICWILGQDIDCHH